MAWDALLGDVGATLLAASLAAVLWLGAAGWRRRAAEAGAARLLRLSDALSAAAVGGWLVGRAATAARGGCAGGGWPGAGAAGASGHAFWAAAARAAAAAPGGGRCAAALAAAAWLWLALATALTPQDACVAPSPPPLPHRDAGLLRTAEDTVSRVKDIVRTLLVQLSTSAGNSSTEPHRAAHRVQKRSPQKSADLTGSHQNAERTSGGNNTPTPQASVPKTHGLRLSPRIILSKISSTTFLKSADVYIPNVKGNENDVSVTKTPLGPRYRTFRYDMALRIIICTRQYNNSSKIRLRNTHSHLQRKINTIKLKALAALCFSTFGLKLEADMWHRKLGFMFPRLENFTQLHLIPRGVIIPEIFRKYLSLLNAKRHICSLLLRDSSKASLCSIISGNQKVQIPSGTVRTGNVFDIMAKINCNLQRKLVSKKSARCSPTRSNRRHIGFRHLFQMSSKAHMGEKYPKSFWKSLQEVFVSRLPNGNRKFSGKAIRQLTFDKRPRASRMFISNYYIRSNARDVAMLSGNKHNRYYKFQMNTLNESDYQTVIVYNCLFDKFPLRFVKRHAFLKIIDHCGPKQAVQRRWKCNTQSDTNKNKTRVKRDVRQRGVRNLGSEGHSRVNRLLPRDSDDISEMAAEEQTKNSEALVNDDGASGNDSLNDLNYTTPEITTPLLPSKLLETTFSTGGTLSDGMDVVSAAPIINTNEEPEDDNHTDTAATEPMEHTESITTSHLETVHSQVEPQSPIEFQTTSESSPIQLGGSTTEEAEIINSTDSDTDGVTWWPPLVNASPENGSSGADCRCLEPPSDPLVAALLLLLGHVAPLVWAAVARCGWGRWRRLSSGVELALWLPGLLGAASRAAGVAAPALLGAGGRAAAAAGLSGALLRVAAAALAAPTVRQAPPSARSAAKASGAAGGGWVEAEAEAGTASSRPASGGGGGGGGGTAAQGGKLSPQLQAVFVVGSNGPTAAGSKVEAPQEPVTQNSGPKSPFTSVPKFLREAAAFLLKRRKAADDTAT